MVALIDDLRLLQIRGKSEALIRTKFMLGTFHQPKSNLHKKVTSAVTKKIVSESIVYMPDQSGFCSKIPPNDVIICHNG